MLRPGGALAIVDLDATVPPLRRRGCAPTSRTTTPSPPSGSSRRQGFSLRRIPTTWRFPDRATCEAVLRIEFSSAVADRALAQCTGLTIPVGYRLHVRHKRLAP